MLTDNVGALNGGAFLRSPNSLLMENIIRFMEKQGYEFAGELNFDDDGISMCQKHTWELIDQDVSFTNFGYLFFEFPKTFVKKPFKLYS